MLSKAIVDKCEEIRKSEIRNEAFFRYLKGITDDDTWNIFISSMKFSSIEEFSRETGISNGKIRAEIHVIWKTLKQIAEQQPFKTAATFILQSCSRLPVYRSVISKSEVLAAARAGLAMAFLIILDRADKPKPS